MKLHSRWFALPLTIVLLASEALASPDLIKFLEGREALANLPPEQQSAEVKGFLQPESVTAIAASLMSPPEPDTSAAKADAALFGEIYKSASAQRWKTAQDDDATMYRRFDDQTGFTLDRATAPSLLTLMNRVAADTFAATAEAKKRFPRPRPFQLIQLKRVCGMAKAPAPESTPTKGGSYPSGHASVSWAIALILMEVSPANAQAIIGRAVSYGNSRIVCGLHFPADVEAGHFVGSAVVARLFESPEFVKELHCARREVEAIARGEKASDLPACGL
jgi:acid phosphatase (class A)